MTLFRNCCRAALGGLFAWLAASGPAAAEVPLDGYLDARFGGGAGLVKHVLSGDPAAVRYPIEVVPVGDGRYWLLADVPQALAPSRMLLARLLADGQLDTSFSGDGVVAPNLAPFAGDTIAGRALKRLPDGKLLVIGERYTVALRNKVFVCRLNVAGNLDGTFGTNGCVSPVLGIVDNAFEYVIGAALRPDGRILLYGATQINQNDTAQSAGYQLMLSANGAVDTTFGAGVGWVLVQPPQSQRTSLADLLPIAGEGEGWFVLGRDTINGTFVSRRRSDGLPDTNWGAAGFRYIDVSDLHQLPQAFLAPRSLAEGPGGGLYFCGSVYYGGGFEKSVLAAARFDAGGAFVPAFGNAGRMLATFEDVFDVSATVSCRGDASGRLTIALSVGTEAPAARDFALMRLLPDGTQDPRFAGIGRVRLPVDVGGPGIGGDHAFGMVAEGERLLVHGVSYYGNSYDIQQGTVLSLVRVGPETLLQDGFE